MVYKTIKLPIHVVQKIKDQRIIKHEPLYSVIERALEALGNTDGQTGKKERKNEKKERRVTDDKEGNALHLFDMFNESYQRRYGVGYVKNAKTMSQCSQLVKRLGFEMAKQVIPFYVECNDKFLLIKKHDLGLLVRDAEVYAVRAKTNQTVISSKLAQSVEDWEGTQQWGQKLHSLFEEVRRYENISSMEGERENETENTEGESG